MVMLYHSDKEKGARKGKRTTMSNETINTPVETVIPEAVGALGADALPASTPEYAPAAQIIVENVTPKREEEEKGDTGAVSGQVTNRASTPLSGGEGHEPRTTSHEPSTIAAADLPQQAYDLMVQFVSRDPRFELNNNARQILAEVQHLRAAVPDAQGNSTDLAAIRETVQHIWTHLQSEGSGVRGQGAEEKGALSTNEGATPGANGSAPTAELINETRTLVRSVNEEVNAVRNNTIQLTNQMRIAMDVTTRCLREMDKTTRKYEQQAEQQTEPLASGHAAPVGETAALLDELRSLRDMLADGFENARLEPIAPEPGEPFRYNEHRAENGFAASGKIKRTLYAGFRWTQPTPPVVLLPAIVETE